MTDDPQTQTPPAGKGQATEDSKRKPFKPALLEGRGRFARFVRTTPTFMVNLDLVHVQLVEPALVDCPTCRGKGRIVTSQDRQTVCDQCKGRGRILPPGTKCEIHFVDESRKTVSAAKFASMEEADEFFEFLSLTLTQAQP